MSNNSSIVIIIEVITQAATAGFRRTISTPVLGTHSLSLNLPRPPCMLYILHPRFSSSLVNHNWPSTDPSQVESSLHRLDQQSIPCNPAAYASLLQACGRFKALSWGKRVHAHILRSGLQGDTFLANQLVTMYGKCGSMEDSRRIFDKMHQRNVVSWNCMIAAYNMNGQGKEALQLFQWMQLEGVKPNEFTFPVVVSACASLAALAEGKTIHALILDSGFESDVVVGAALVNMYVKCGSVEDARRVFDRIPRRNVVLWNIMIAAYTRNGQGKEALQLFQWMQLEGVKPDEYTFTKLLSLCASLAALAEGKTVHARILESGLESNVAVGTALVKMYAKCGSVEDARRIFDRMHQRDVVLWTVMISAYTQHGQGKKALQLFEWMQLEGVKPNEFTFTGVLSACASLAALAEGKMIHARILESGVESHVHVRGALVNMYAKCGSVEDARRMFDRMHQRDVVSWTAMISAYTQDGQGKKALQLFQWMQLEGVKPNEFTFTNLLFACASLAALAEGKAIHALILESGLESSVAVGTALVHMYAKCGSVEDARRIFDRMHQRGVALWTSMISAYTQQGQGKQALQLFQNMQLEGVKPNERTFASALFACASVAALAEGKMIHAHVVESGCESNVNVGNALIIMYAKCGSVEEARGMFDRMPKRNVLSWNAMIAAYAHHGQGKEALQIFRGMQLEGVKPNKITFIGAFSACASLAALAEGKMIHAHLIQTGIELDDVVRSALVNMYAKCGRVEDAQKQNG